MVPRAHALGKHRSRLTGLGVVRASVVRIAPLLAVVCLLAGCAAHVARAPAAPDDLIVVFADGFHSGVLLPRDLVPARLQPHGAVDLQGWGWVVVHFGERRWILGEADSCLDAVRLAVLTGEGGVQVDVVPWWMHDRGGTDTEHERVWVFPASRGEIAGLLARLAEWLGPSGGGQIGPATCWWPSSRAWTLARNCHDFTADLLAGAGIRLGRRPIEVAGAMHAALDRAWRERMGLR